MLTISGDPMTIDTTNFPKRADMTVSEIQSTLSEARDMVQVVLDSHNSKTDSNYARLLLLFTTLDEVQKNSNSLNEFPGLRGLGLESVLLLAQKIVAKGSVSTADFNVNYRLLSEGFIFN
jgi:hypothetical protein